MEGQERLEGCLSYYSGHGCASRDPNHCILLSPNFSLKATFVSARLVTKANLERTVPALKEGLVSSEEGVARVGGAAGDTKGEVC